MGDYGTQYGSFCSRGEITVVSTVVFPVCEETTVVFPVFCPVVMLIYGEYYGDHYGSFSGSFSGSFPCSKVDLR